MKFRLLKDKKLRNKILKNELYVVSYKFLISNYILKQNPLYILNLINFNYFHTYLSHNSKSKIHNYCTITGRARGIISFFNMSRLTFRDLASKGLISGIKRSVW